MNTADTLAQKMNTAMDDAFVTPEQKVQLLEISRMKPAEIAAMPKMDESFAKAFSDSNFAQFLDKPQTAVLALSQPRKIMEDHQIVNSINRFLKFDDKIQMSEFLSMKMGSFESEKDQQELLSKVTKEQQSPTLPTWPSNLRAVSFMTPKDISSLPPLNAQQVDEFMKSNVESYLSPKQISVIALTQDSKVFPDEVATNATNKFLQGKDKINSFYNFETVSIRDDLIKKVVSAEPHKEITASLSGRFMSLFSVKEPQENAQKPKAPSPY